MGGWKQGSIDGRVNEFKENEKDEKILRMGILYTIIKMLATEATDI